MSFLPTILTIIHVIVSVFLILVVLLQQGKSTDWAGAFGGGGSQTAFGARGAATALTKATVVAAVAFLLTSMSLTILISRPGGSTVIREGAAPQQQEQPVSPLAAPPQDTAPQQQDATAPAEPVPPAGQ